MEKIQSALEKARRQRSAGTAPAARRGDTAPPPARSVGPSETIAYRDTRVVRSSAEFLERRRVVAGLTHHELADTFRILRTRTLQRLDEDGCTTLAIVSSGRGEGKTLTAVNLALSIAMTVTRTVLLVDADLRSPNVHDYFGIDPEPGLTGHLIQGLPLSECLVNPGVDRLVVLPAGTKVRSSSEMLSSPQMADLAEQLKRRYPDRVVIYDLAPILASDDAIAFLQNVERVLFLTAAGVTHIKDIPKALELVPPDKIAGIVLNKADEKPKKYYG